jgi:outer membrane protein insertion porin family
MLSGLYHQAVIIADRCRDVPSVLSAVQFYGVSNTKHDALLKEISELYNSRNLDELIRNAHCAAEHMQEMGLFEGCAALVDVSPNANDSYVVNFVAREPRPFNLGAKVGMTSQGDADASLTAVKQSFLGRGETVSATYSKTAKGGQSFDFTANKPILGWQKYSSFGIALHRAFESLPWNKADLVENGVILIHNGQLWARRLLYSCRLNAMWRFLSPQTNAPFPVREHAGHTTKLSLENTLGFDTRNRRILASRGFLFKVGQEYAGLVGDSAFVKHQLDIQAAAPLFLGAFIGASLQCTAVNSLADRVLHLLDRAYLGGPHDIRGFQMRSIGTRAENACLGGAASYACAIHLYRSLIPKNMLFAHAFATAGSVCSVRSRSWLRDLVETPRTSVGIGVTFVFRDLVRLELNYVLPIRYVAGDACAPGLQFGAGINFL